MYPAGVGPSLEGSTETTVYGSVTPAASFLVLFKEKLYFVIAASCYKHKNFILILQTERPIIFEPHPHIH